MRDQLGEVQAPPRAVAGLVEVEETVHRLQKAGRAPELRGVGLVWVLQLVQVQVQEQKMTVTGRHYPLMAALVPVLEDEDRVEELVWQCCLAVEVLELTAADLAEVLLTV